MRANLQIRQREENHSDHMWYQRLSDSSVLRVKKFVHCHYTLIFFHKRCIFKLFLKCVIAHRANSIPNRYHFILQGRELGALEQGTARVCKQIVWLKSAPTDPNLEKRVSGNKTPTFTLTHRVNFCLQRTDLENTPSAVLIILRKAVKLLLS